jgi:hypothetical protein
MGFILPDHGLREYHEFLRECVEKCNTKNLCPGAEGVDFTLFCATPPPFLERQGQWRA